MDEYKEHGLEFRHLDTQVSATSRFMIPPLVIGLLVLYGEVDKFLGVEFKNPQALHFLVWFGCVLISLMWIFNVSRHAQLSHSHLDTRSAASKKFGLSGQAKIEEMDADSDLLNKILRHNKLRFISFGIYFFFLLFKLKSMTFYHLFLNSAEEHVGLITVIVSIYAIFVSIYLSGWIYSLYFIKSLRSSRTTPTDIRKTQKREFQDAKKCKPKTSISKRIFLHIIPGVIFFTFLAVLILSLVYLQGQSDIHDYLVNGLTSLTTGHYDQAIDNFSKVIALYPNNAGAYFNRGSAYYNRGDFACAIIDLDKAIALDPQNHSARALRDKAQRELEN